MYFVGCFGCSSCRARMAWMRVPSEVLKLDDLSQPSKQNALWFMILMMFAATAVLCVYRNYFGETSTCHVCEKGETSWFLKVKHHHLYIWSILKSKLLEKNMWLFQVLAVCLQEIPKAVLFAPLLKAFMPKPPKTHWATTCIIQPLEKHILICIMYLLEKWLLNIQCQHLNLYLVCFSPPGPSFSHPFPKAKTETRSKRRLFQSIRSTFNPQDEQEREITMKSSAIALRWISPKKETFLATRSSFSRGFSRERSGDREN